MPNITRLRGQRRHQTRSKGDLLVLSRSVNPASTPTKRGRFPDLRKALIPASDASQRTKHLELFLQGPDHRSVAKSLKKVHINAPNPF